MRASLCLPGPGITCNNGSGSHRGSSTPHRGEPHLRKNILPRHMTASRRIFRSIQTRRPRDRCQTSGVSAKLPNLWQCTGTSWCSRRLPTRRFPHYSSNIPYYQLSLRVLLVCLWIALTVSLPSTAMAESLYAQRDSPYLDHPYSAGSGSRTYTFAHCSRAGRAHTRQRTVFCPRKQTSCSASLVCAAFQIAQIMESSAKLARR